MEAQVRRPRGIDDERDARLVRGLRVPRQVPGGPHVGRVAEEHRARPWMGGQRVPDGAHRDRGGQATRVRLGPHPHRPQPGQHQPEQQRPVQAPGDDHLLAGRAHRQRQRLVAVGRAGHREPAPVRSPQPGRSLLRVGEQRVGVLDRVQPAIQRHVADGHRPGQILALFVPGDRHRVQQAGLRLRGEPQPGVQQRRIGTQPVRVTGVSRLRGRPAARLRHVPSPNRRQGRANADTRRRCHYATRS
jgi:hypothetical protein